MDTRWTVERDSLLLPDAVCGAACALEVLETRTGRLTLREQRVLSPAESCADLGAIRQSGDVSGCPLLEQEPSSAVEREHRTLLTGSWNRR